MKYKFLIPIALSIVIGLFFGKVFFDNYKSSSLTVFDEKDKVYMLQIGVYSSEEKMKSSFKNYDKFLYIEKDDGIHLYVGITKDKEIASRIKDYYEKNGYSIYIKESILDNQSFLSVLGEYDKIIGITGDNDLKGIEEIVISNYKEMVLESEN
ncbi:MAG: hypothetical protein ACI4PE_01375 [Bacilli bacterium]